MAKKVRAKYKEEALVLHTVKYGERRIIANVLTREHGRCGYIVSVGSGANSVHRAMLQPLTCLEYEGEMPTISDGLHKMSDVRMVRLGSSDGEYSPVRSMLVMFISELLFRVIKDCDNRLYEFVRELIHKLMSNKTEGIALANFHLYFMVALASELGYSPMNNYSVGDYFDIAEGSFVANKPQHNSFFEPLKARLLNDLLHLEYSKLESLELSRDERRSFLYSMVDYYGYHTSAIHSVRSIEVLGDIL